MKLFAVVGQDFLHLDWASLLQGVQKRASCSVRLVGLRGLFGLERDEAAHAVAAQTPVKARASRLGTVELWGNSQQVIQG